MKKKFVFVRVSMDYFLLRRNAEVAYSSFSTFHSSTLPSNSRQFLCGSRDGGSGEKKWGGDPPSSFSASLPSARSLALSNLPESVISRRAPDPSTQCNACGWHSCDLSLRSLHSALSLGRSDERESALNGESVLPLAPLSLSFSASCDALGAFYSLASARFRLRVVIIDYFNGYRHYYCFYLFFSLFLQNVICKCVICLDPRRRFNLLKMRICEWENLLDKARR